MPAPQPRRHPADRRRVAGHVLVVCSAGSPRRRRHESRAGIGPGLVPQTARRTIRGGDVPEWADLDPTFPTSNGPTPVVVVADTGYNRITIFDPTDCPMPDTSTCAPIETFGSEGSGNGQFDTDRDVAVDADSNIYVADAANSRIEAFNYTGHLALECRRRRPIAGALLRVT